MLALDVCPMSWPVGMGGEFEGVLDLTTNTISRPEGDSRAFLGKTEADPTLSDRWAEEIELAQAGYAEFDGEAYRNGDLTPVYFGSALKDFGRADVRFTGLPNFAPEILRRVQLKDPTKTKQLRKALDDMAEEGVTQVFYPEIGSNWIIGVVGQLQLEVLLSRLEVEYKVAAGLEPAPFETARWVSAQDPADLKAFTDLNRSAMAKDRDGNPVFLAKSAWEVGYIADRYNKVKFAATRER
ncbi:hypothetical protein WR25_24159 [Diploscapter pachys]|uniref:Peptide chain release factor 3 C-terminal domain-containing protein n=1 Tax=Diploscapter pachys TaxID=2018661 RepID=A0A2A2KJB0_9BILA|nr:hypothetical protein WR25_24159 [Diploscapter pachys]